MKITCYILDDEQQAVDALTILMQKKFADEVTVLGSSTDPLIAIKEIETFNPDLLFLDMEMPSIRGLDLLDEFPSRKFEVIITTAHEKYALPALKAAAVDYLVKPLSPREVYDSIQKVRLRLQLQRTNLNSTTAGKLLLPTQHVMVLVDIQDIVRIESQNNYSHFFFVNRPRLIVSRTLKEFDEQLASQGFFRVHQSHLINLQHVDSIESKDGDYVIMKQGDRVEISRRKKAEFLERLRNL